MNKEQAFDDLHKTYKNLKKKINLKKGINIVTLKVGKNIKKPCEHFVKYKLFDIVDDDIKYNLSCCLSCNEIELSAFHINDLQALEQYNNNVIDHAFISCRPLLITALLSGEYKKFSSMYQDPNGSEEDIAKSFKSQFDSKYKVGEKNGPRL